MAIKYTTCMLVGAYVRATITNISDTYTQWSEWTTNEGLFDTPTAATQAVIDFLESRPFTWDDLDADGNPEWYDAPFLMRAPASGIGGASIQWAYPQTGYAGAVIKPSTASITRVVQFTGDLTVDLEGIYPVDYKLYNVPTGYELYWCEIDADWYTDDVGSFAAYKIGFFVTGIPEGSALYDEDITTYSSSEDYDNWNFCGYDDVGTGSGWLVLSEYNMQRNYLDVSGAEIYAGVSDPFDLLNYSGLINNLNSFSEDEPLAVTFVMPGFGEETISEFQLKWNDDGKWYPNQTDTSAKLKYAAGVSIIQVLFGPSNARKAIIRPDKAGGFMIYEVASFATLDTAIGLVKIFRHDRTLGQVVPPELLPVYLPGVVNV